MDHEIRTRGRLALGLGLSAMVAGAPAAAGAGALSVMTRLGSCDSGAMTSCADTGAVDTTPANASSAFIGQPSIAGAPATFTTAFDAWDEANGNAWRLIDGGALDLSVDASIEISASDRSAGLSPVIFTLSGGRPWLLRRLVWTQALAISYTPLGGPLAAPIQTLDTFSLSQDAAGDNRGFPRTCVAASAGAAPPNGVFCGPIYPFQYGSTMANVTLDGVTLGVDPFYDAPQGDWPGASFEAVTLLSEITAPHTLTVFQGVSYSFSLSATASGSSSPGAATADPVPEPSTSALALCGFAALGLARYRAKRAATAG
ncbi:hypothetical protein DFR50_109182 [Roseiarcus fermentans]|uniref:Secreted protein with PEP-CTERM sorting signal n=1 Tax=Roseiarcus fermentans TaxID=1473586 RepID=A0A366FIE5_9HYPH|nr:PEP-CTERM sorting domain-containing protein [Roseiarcus fermentans]RBP14428.1 hypothetical protein DFR50_109182 [Roseiarcus fermentans]